MPIASQVVSQVLSGNELSVDIAIEANFDLDAH